jgi:hypothetical protein
VGSIRRDAAENVAQPNFSMQFVKLDHTVVERGDAFGFQEFGIGAEAQESIRLMEQLREKS